jgi:hypothetical protein
MAQPFLERYDGQTTEELIALEGRYRIDSLVLAFEQGIGLKPPARTSKQETYVLAVEALEREVNNGGYNQFFINSSNEFTGIVEEALRAIGCPKTAEITHQAIAALKVQGTLTPDNVAAAAADAEDVLLEALGGCDDRYFANDEPIADKLFAWIKANRDSIRLGAA